MHSKGEERGGNIVISLPAHQVLILTIDLLDVGVCLSDEFHVITSRLWKPLMNFPHVWKQRSHHVEEEDNELLYGEEGVIEHHVTYSVQPGPVLCQSVVQSGVPPHGRVPALLHGRHCFALTTVDNI